MDYKAFLFGAYVSLIAFSVGSYSSHVDTTNQTFGGAFISTIGTSSFPGAVGVGTSTPFGLLQVASTTGNGTVSTSTLTIGAVGTTTSRSCITMKNQNGEEVSMWFIDTTPIYELSKCK